MPATTMMPAEATAAVPVEATTVPAAAAATAMPEEASELVAGHAWVPGRAWVPAGAALETPGTTVVAVQTLMDAAAQAAAEAVRDAAQR